MKTIFNKMYVADMYIKVTQYDKMQRAPATAGHTFVLFRSIYYSVYRLTVCVFLYDEVLFSDKCI